MKKIPIFLPFVLFAFLIGTYLADCPPEYFQKPTETGQAVKGGAFRAFEWWYAQRSRPFDFIPNDGFQNASRHVKSYMKKEQIRQSGGEGISGWTSIGPFNIGGRVLALAVDPVDPEIIWAGAASGGLWKSTTGGTGTTAWNYINTGFNTVSVSAVSIDPTNPDIIFIGTGEISHFHRPLVGTPGARSSYGMGILKSTDGGTTWSQTGLTWTFPEITAVQKIVINPANGNTIFAAASEGIFRSTSGGASWTIASSVPMAMDIVMSPADTSVLFSSHGNLNSSPNPGLYKTTDAGGTWIQLVNGLPTLNFGRTSLSVSISDPSTIYAGVANAASSGILGLYKSTDEGTLWSAVSTTNYVGSQGWYDNVIAVHPRNPDTIFCAGLDIHKSVNGGPTLPAISTGIVHVDHHAIAFDPINPRIVYFGTDGGVYKTTDGGETFIDCNGGFVTTQFYPGFANARLDSGTAIGGLQDNGTLKYSGSGDWTQIFGADGGWCAIDPANSSIMYFEYQWLQLYKSTNGGWSASPIMNGLPTGSGNTNFIAPFILSPSDPNILYAGCKNVYKSTNAGSSWFSSDGQATLNNIQIACIGVSWTSPDTLIAGTGTGAFGAPTNFEIFSSADGGQNWTNVTYNLNGSDSLPFRYPTDISFDPANSRSAYLTYSGYYTAHVFMTTDLGNSWTDISSNLPDVPCQAICVDPEDRASLYLGTDLGVFYSSDGGTSWQDLNDGMPPAMVLDLTISDANDKLRASTFGNGVYERALIRIPDVTLTAPNGGEIWAADHFQTIRWAEKFVDNVKLEYSSDNGLTWEIISDNVPAYSGSYSWMIPRTAATEALVRISDAAGGNTADTSDAPFTIIMNADVVEGWNLLSLHLAVPDPLKTTLFPTALSDAFGYDVSYVASDSLYNGLGYWLKFGAPEIIPLSGDTLVSDTIDLRRGWNLIGSITQSVAVSDITEIPTDIVISEYFSYRNGYLISDSVKPRSGYWVKADSDGKIILSTAISNLKEMGNLFNENRLLNSITITDGANNKQTLYFTADSASLDVRRYDLPPIPPGGAFDVRFANHGMVEYVPTKFRSYHEIPILIRSYHYPITISWNICEEGTEYSLIETGRKYRTITGKGSRQIDGNIAGIIVHAGKSSNSLPSSFRLSQNYPNPFNPTTIIDYQLPVPCPVRLKVYDIRGREITTLAEEYQDAGLKSVEFSAVGKDGSLLPTGIYFFRLEAETFSDVKKMLLVR